MTAKDFYRILSQVRKMQWALAPSARTAFGVPSSTSFIRGERHSFYYSPLTAVASAVRRDFVDVSNSHINRIIRLDGRTYNRILCASYQFVGYSKSVRRKLLRACRLPLHWA